MDAALLVRRINDLIVVESSEAFSLEAFLHLVLLLKSHQGINQEKRNQNSRGCCQWDMWQGSRESVTKETGKHEEHNNTSQLDFFYFGSGDTQMMNCCSGSSARNKLFSQDGWANMQNFSCKYSIYIEASWTDKSALFDTQSRTSKNNGHRWGEKRLWNLHKFEALGEFCWDTKTCLGFETKWVKSADIQPNAAEPTVKPHLYFGDYKNNPSAVCQASEAHRQGWTQTEC